MGGEIWHYFCTHTVLSPALQDGELRFKQGEVAFHEKRYVGSDRIDTLLCRFCQDL